MIRLVERSLENELGLSQHVLEIEHLGEKIGEGMSVEQDNEYGLVRIMMIVPINEIEVQQGEPIELPLEEYDV